MNAHATFSSFSLSRSILVLSLFAFTVFSQEKPKLKDFGSSLKKLKWDPKVNAAVDKGAKEKPKTSESDDVVRVETSLVISDLLVMNERGQIITGLTQNDFVVSEDGRAQQVGMFSVGDNAAVPRSIVLIIDYSGSQLPFINTSIAAAKGIVDKLGPLDRMAIVTDDVELLTDFTRDKTQQFTRWCPVSA